jgi:hypothetical protein
MMYGVNWMSVFSSKSRLMNASSAPRVGVRLGILRATDRKWIYDTKALYCITSQRRPTYIAVVVY